MCQANQAKLTNWRLTYEFAGKMKVVGFTLLNLLNQLNKMGKMPIKLPDLLEQNWQI